MPLLPDQEGEEPACTFTATYPLHLPPIYREIYKNNMGAISTVKTENGKISCETPEGTVVNININQRSALDCMLDAMKTMRIKRHGGDKEPTRAHGSAIQLGFGVSLISVGVLCVGLAIIFAVAHPFLEIVFSGVHFWVGFPFIVSGVLNIVAYRYPNPCWMVISFIFLLSCLGVSIAGLAFTINDLSWHWQIGDPCYSIVEALENQKRNNYYDMTEAPRRYDNDNYELQNCRQRMRQYQVMQNGLVIMSLLMMIWGICASCISLGFRLKQFCNACKCEAPEEENKDEPLLPPNPSNEVFNV